jgi:predicted AAA+ superfamily ATPase
VGVVNFLAKRGTLEPGSELYGKAFENWCFHELNAYNLYCDSFAELSYWRLASGYEVDFIVNDLAIAIEAKAVARITSDHLKGLRALKQDQNTVGRAIVVCLAPKPRRTDDGIEIMPVRDFCQALWAGEMF